MGKQVSDKELLRFLNQVTQLSEMEFIGLARILNISLVEDNEEKTPKDFEYIISDLIDKYLTLNREKRKNLKKILHKALKDKE